MFTMSTNNYCCLGFSENQTNVYKSYFVKAAYVKLKCVSRNICVEIVLVVFNLWLLNLQPERRGVNSPCWGWEGSVVDNVRRGRSWWSLPLLHQSLQMFTSTAAVPHCSSCLLIHIILWVDIIGESWLISTVTTRGVTEGGFLSCVHTATISIPESTPLEHSL